MSKETKNPLIEAFMKLHEDLTRRITSGVTPQVNGEYDSFGIKRAPYVKQYGDYAKSRLSAPETSSSTTTNAQAGSEYAQSMKNAFNKPNPTAGSENMRFAGGGPTGTGPVKTGDPISAGGGTVRPAIDAAPKPQPSMSLQRQQSGDVAPKIDNSASMNRAKTDFQTRVGGAERQNQISAPGKLEGGNLQKGSRGDSVKELQRKLGIKDDGIFGDDTADALKGYQQKNNLKVDGIYGKQSSSAMIRTSSLDSLKKENPVGAALSAKSTTPYISKSSFPKSPMPISGNQGKFLVRSQGTPIEKAADSRTTLTQTDKPITAADPSPMGVLSRFAGNEAVKRLKAQNQTTSEETNMSNKLIDSFLQLQAMKTDNIFEAAKKIKKLDPVGKEDEDIDNDGDKDKSDGYLHNRRKKIASAMEAVDPNAEGIAKYKEKAPIMVPNPDYPTSKPGPTRELKGSLPKGVTVKGNTNEEVEALDEVAVPDNHKKAMIKAYGPGRVTVSNGMIHHKNKKFGETISHKYDPKKNQPIGQHLGTITVQEEVEQIDEALSADHKSAIKAHIRGMWGRGEVAFGSQGGREFVSHSDGIQKRVHSIHMKKGVPHVTHFLSMDEEVEQIDELTPSTLRSYRDSANWDVRGIRSGDDSNDDFDRDAMMKRRRKGAVLSAKKLRGTAKVNAKEEVEFSEAELEHIAAILEGPVAPTPSGYEVKAFGSSTSRSGTLTDEAIAEEEAKRGRGRPMGSKSGSKYGSSGGNAAGVTHLVDQIKHAGTRGISDGKGNYMLKHEHGTNKDGSPKVLTAAVPQKSANDFYKAYHNTEKPTGKQEIHDKFVAKHFDVAKPQARGISLASMPRPKS